MENQSGNNDIINPEISPEPENLTTTHTENNSNSNSPSPKSHKKLILITLIVLIIISLLSFGAYYYQNHKSKKVLVIVNKNTIVTQKTNSTITNGLLTYVNQGKPSKLLVTNSQQKTLSSLNMPSGKNTFSILANNGSSALIEVANIVNGPDTNATYYMINSSGQSTQLSNDVSKTINNVSISGEYLGNNDNLFYVTCSTNLCSLMGLNLSTNISKTITSSPYEVIPHIASGYETSLSLLGISSNNTAYIITYPLSALKYSSTSSAEPLIFSEINLNTLKTITSYNLANYFLNPPVLSNDFKYIVYTSQTDNTTTNLMDLSNGKTNQIKPDIAAGADYIWSPDSQKIAFIANPTPATNNGTPKPATPITLEYIDVSTLKSNTINTFGDSKSNNIIVNGWSSSLYLNYNYTQSSTPNNFTNAPIQYSSVNISNKIVNTNPAPSGYSLISPTSLSSY